MNQEYKLAIRKTSQTFTEGLFAVLCWTFLAISAGTILVWIFNISFVFFMLWSLFFFFLFGAWLMENFSLEVPAQTGRNLKNYFSGKLQTYGSGFFFIYPWQMKRNGKGIYSLQIVKEDLIEDYPAEDGPVLIGKLMFRYSPELDLLVQFELVDTNAIKVGLKEHASSFLLAHIKGHPAENIRDGLDGLQTDLKRHFGITMEGKPEEVSILEKAFGIKITFAALSDLDYEPQFQSALTNAKIVSKIMEQADVIYLHHGGTINEESGGCVDGHITRKEAFDKAMVLFDKATQATFKGSKTVLAAGQ